jgi:hypothetical protein
MARGRMISKTLGSSLSFLALSKDAGELVDFSRILFVLLVANADDFGRLEGDAMTVKLRVFPVSDKEESEFSKALGLLESHGLINWYRVEKRQIIEICQFADHQQGLHKRTASKFPDPPAKRRGARGSSRSVDQATRICDLYESLFQEIKKQPYLATDDQRARDKKASKELCMAYEEEEISRIIKQFLSLPENHPKLKQWEGQSKTIPMLLRVAASIAKVLDIQGVVA